GRPGEFESVETEKVALIFPVSPGFKFLSYPTGPSLWWISIDQPPPHQIVNAATVRRKATPAQYGNIGGRDLSANLVFDASHTHDTKCIKRWIRAMKRSADNNWRILFLHDHAIEWYGKILYERDHHNGCRNPECVRDDYIPLSLIVSLLEELRGETVIISNACLGSPLVGPRPGTVPFEALDTRKIVLVFPVSPGFRFTAYTMDDPTRKFILMMLASFDNIREALLMLNQRAPEDRPHQQDRDSPIKVCLHSLWWWGHSPS
ncbi:hypothetical protein PRIPAC_93845, partial [Pristionchus pacificus]|uniref:Uncharacterized protein n=1 Tax=Pristionchus pacificus TaxID=54126 RepID=A0A2A6CCX9_PRIPA